MEDIKNTYEYIAKDFDRTRYALWKGVRSFLDKISAYSIVGDLGCGNGKYLGYRNDIIFIGCDLCSSLLEIASSKKNGDVVLANIVYLPFNNNVFDYVIHIAVFHHLPTIGLRQQFLRELRRILRNDGEALITVWAREQVIPKKWIDLGCGDYHVPWRDKCMRYYHLFEKEELERLIIDVGGFDIINIEYEKDNWQVVLRKNML